MTAPAAFMCLNLPSGRIRNACAAVTQTGVTGELRGRSQAEGHPSQKGPVDA